MYADKEKQREANRKAQAKRRGMTEGMTEKVDVTPEHVTPARTRKLAEIAIDPRFERIARSLGPLGSEVRVGMFGPDVASLWEATH